MISLSQVSKWYMPHSKVLDQIDLELKAGEFLYVIGGTGAGKTSLLKMLATEETPSSGALSLFGRNLTKISPISLRRIRRAMGYIPQDIQLISDLSVYENIRLSLDLAGSQFSKKDADSRIQPLLKSFGLLGKKDKLCSQLSGGEAQRVAAVRALVREPQIIVADEPTGAQDRNFTWTLMEHLVLANKRGATVIVATHDQEIVRRVRKKCAILRSGKVQVEEAQCIY